MGFVACCEKQHQEITFEVWRETTFEISDPAKKRIICCAIFQLASNKNAKHITCQVLTQFIQSLPSAKGTDKEELKIKNFFKRMNENGGDKEISVEEFLEFTSTSNTPAKLNLELFLDQAVKGKLI